MPIFENNRALLDKFRNGDHNALTHVYYQYVDEIAMLVRHGFSVGQNEHLFIPGAGGPETEADLIQTIFERAFSEKARNRYDGLRPYRGYLFQIAKNIMIDTLRKRKRAAIHGDDSIGRELGVGNIDELIEQNAQINSSPHTSPEDLLHWENLLQATKNYVSTLDKQMHTFVHFRFGQEKSQSEVTSLMGISRAKVRTLESRIQRGLKKHLKKVGF